MYDSRTPSRTRPLALGLYELMFKEANNNLKKPTTKLETKTSKTLKNKKGILFFIQKIDRQWQMADKVIIFTIKIVADYIFIISSFILLVGMFESRDCSITGYRSSHPTLHLE